MSRSEEIQDQLRLEDEEEGPDDGCDRQGIPACLRDRHVRHLAVLLRRVQEVARSTLRVGTSMTAELLRK